jgi:hypothetical protein
MKIKLHYKIFLISFFIVFVSCNPRKAQEKLADERLKQIEQLISENSLNAAKIQIDSIHLLFPKLVEKRIIAAAFEDTIVRRESVRNLAYCDSILPFKQHEADSIQKNFRFEKDTVYQQFGNFVYKTQRTENNANRTYIKSYVDENADFYLISNYTGSRIEHISVRVSTNDLFAQTDSIETSNSNYHSFNDGGTHWETITFKNETDKGVASFISQYAKERLKVTLQGKKTYIYYLSNADKKAISETYNLWVVKKDVIKLLKEIKKSKIKIERINQRKSKI